MDLYFSKKEISLKLHQLAPCEGVVRCGRRPAAAGRAQSALRGGLALQRRRSGGAVGPIFLEIDRDAWNVRIGCV